jgi:hypothetical protein
MTDDRRGRLIAAARAGEIINVVDHEGSDDALQPEFKRKS